MILEIQSIEKIGVEPTDLATAQLYFRSEDSNGIEDDIIQSFLIQAREGIEKTCNLSLVEKKIELYLDEYIGFLPYGPIDLDTLEVTEGSAEFKGKTYPYCNGSINATVEYITKAVDSQDLINAIYELASYWYFRGDNGRAIPDKIKPVIKRHTRNLFA
jgi:hypothetical protein